MRSVVVSLCLSICLLLSHAGAQDNQRPTDSSQIRVPEPQEKSTAEKLLDVPEFVLKLPLKSVKLFSKFMIHEVVDTRVTKNIAELVGKLDRVYGFYPVLGWGANQGISGGIGFRSKGVLTVEERLKLKASYSTHDYQRYKVRYIAPGLLRSSEGITFLLTYDKKPWQRFYGLGAESEETDESAFTSEETHFQIDGAWRLGGQTLLDMWAGYRAVNLYDGKNPDRVNELSVIRENLNLSADVFDQARVWSFGATVTHDWRDNKFQPSRGGIEIISLSYNKGVDISDDLEYVVTRIDLRHYLEIFRKRLFAFRVMAKSTDTQNDSPELPFYLRSHLGGFELLRGYLEHRFVDNDLMLATVEYRYPVWRIVDAFVFIDEARVFDDIFENFTFRNWQYSIGGGLRVWGVGGTVTSLQLAGSNEGFQAYFELSEDF